VPPVYIDPSAQIEHAVIGPYVSIGSDCQIRRSILRDTVVDAESTILDSMLTGSLIGRQAHVNGRDRILNVGDSSEVGFA